ncbi:MAG: glycosyltransferase [Candidatus Auribacter fodinae]|jgi:glycosyltransferase involved in cell wall biosynthesis|uniref:Glycosyltransferase n=1 Tax=Candidatus Auribacter fodinae TaxID=2093366 RepID=A0A3A4RA14_9BACT|nr:MAG: glycosyltransferase [Candidatus Auribacter fodinae]
MTMPFVSVVVPAYNAAATIGQCIESLISQTYPKEKLEILIIDNNSSDETADIIRSYPVTYLSESNQSRSAARNKGIRHARGDIIAFTDSDCAAQHDWLEKGVQPFEDEWIGGVGGPILAYNPSTWIERAQDILRIFNQEETISPERVEAGTAVIATPNALYRKDALLAAGLFDERLKGAEDYDLSYKIQRITDYSFAYQPDAITYHRHAQTFEKVVTQYFRYGYAYMECEEQKECLVKLDESIRAHGLARVVYWKILQYRIPANLKRCVSYGLKYLFSLRQDTKQYLELSFLDCVQQAAFLAGEMQSYMVNRVRLRENKN